MSGKKEKVDTYLNVSGFGRDMIYVFGAVAAGGVVDAPLMYFELEDVPVLAITIGVIGFGLVLVGNLQEDPAEHYRKYR